MGIDGHSRTITGLRFENWQETAVEDDRLLSFGNQMKMDGDY